MVLAITLTAVAGYRLGVHRAHVREIERIVKFCDAALSESRNWFKVYDETGDDTAYWKAASALGTYISIYEQLEDEDPDRAEVESVRVLLTVHSIHPFGMWPGDLQETHKLIRLCNRIEEAAKD